MDHFKEKNNCRVVDKCHDEIPTDAIPRIAPVQRQQDNGMALYGADYENSLGSCNKWRPSEDEPGSCTNERVPPGKRWPESIFRSTHLECCKDFFSMERCSILDVCSSTTSYD